MAKRAWLLLTVAVIARIVSLWILRTDVYFELIPRSFTGRELLSMPAWLDLAVPLMIIIMLWPQGVGERITVRAVGSALADAAGLLLFPLLTGLALFVYIQHWFVTLHIDWMSLMRLVQFVAAFLALNLLVDALAIGNRWMRWGVAFAAALALGVMQDITLTMSPEYLVMGLLSGVGTTMMLTALAFRPLYRQSPWRASLSALCVGIVTCFVIVAAESSSVFTLLPGVALVIGAIVIRRPSVWPRWAALAIVVAVSLGLSLGLPRLVEADVASMIVENVRPPLTTEHVGSMTVRYGDPRVRNIALGLAHVLECANAVSLEEYGVSPQVDELVIYGIAPGGFYAEFPNRIVGNLASEEYIRRCSDASYLNAPGTSIHFPDPVNAILHEYSHLYGMVPYLPWVMGAEEEGWATYAATRLSIRLDQKYGSGLWATPYAYAARARAITQSNLWGHPVAWSHANEFGGFALWSALGKRDGDSALFSHRWSLTQRSLARFVMMQNDPEAARRMAGGMGGDDFRAFGKAEPVAYDHVIALQDWMAMSDVMGVAPERAKAQYAMRSALEVTPAVTVPAPPPQGLDFMATLLIVLVTAGWYGVTKRRPEDA